MKEEEIIQQRHNKLKELRKEGIEPYGRAFLRKPISEVQEGEKEVSAAGRIMAFRKHGKVAFLDICDWTGKMQLYFKKGILSEKGYRLFENLDIGDIIGVKGEVFKTRTGELTILVQNLTVLAKSLRPLPEKWHGLKDVEARFRHRYVDLIINEEVREIFKKRMNILQYIREFLNGKEFMEVETPMMHPISGGAEAKPFITYHNTLETDLYLRIAPELYLKRLLVGGFEKIYEINRSFRNEGISTLHNPEFTMLELYSAYGDCEEMMKIAENLLTFLAEKINGGLEMKYRDETINFSSPWKRITWTDCFKKVGIDNWKDIKIVQKKIEEFNLEVNKDEKNNLFGLLETIFKRKIQQEFINPTFVIEYPEEVSPLAKSYPDNPHMTERFELYIGGIELSNAYSELNDPIEQKDRFLKEIKSEMSERPKVLDSDYIEALEYGMPPAGGLGIGIDRLVMLFTNTSSIREVVLFPLLRPTKK